MSKAFPTDKDDVIDALDDVFDLKLTEEEFACLRLMRLQDLLLLTSLFSRARKANVRR